RCRSSRRLRTIFFASALKLSLRWPATNRGTITSRLPTPAFRDWDEAPKEEPYIFHFPDGNASVARLLVRSLIPEAIPGHTMEDVVTAKVDYSKLDMASSQSMARIRLNTTVVRVRHVGEPKTAKEVEVAYMRGEKL